MLPRSPSQWCDFSLFSPLFSFDLACYCHFTILVLRGWFHGLSPIFPAFQGRLIAGAFPKTSELSKTFKEWAARYSVNNPHTCIQFHTDLNKRMGYWERRASDRYISMHILHWKQIPLGQRYFSLGQILWKWERWKNGQGNQQRANGSKLPPSQSLDESWQNCIFSLNPFLSNPSLPLLS